ncbi:MAG: DUF5050 domain-containing protein [Paludibacteraceae bacterium]|nr:DUF5050 domain-containing protein [Paludibacteraceae bacterium]
MKKIYLLLVYFIALQVAVKAQDRIYWGVPNVAISSAKFDGTDIKQAVTLSGQTYDMETDFYKNVLYWGDGSTVKKANADGTNVQTLYTASGTIGALALDLTNNKLYFSQYGSTHALIVRCNLDGTGLDTIVTSPISSASTYTLAISTTLQKLYWTEYSTSSYVLRCNLDGTNVETLMTVSNFMPGLSIDEKNQKLFLAYWNDNEVMTTDMTCSTTPTLVFGTSNGTFQMAVNNQENKLYFAEMATGKIRKCNLDGTSPQDIISLASGNRIMALSIPTVPAAPTIVENETYTFKLKDFLFSAVDKDSLTKIQITSLPAKGTMYLDANKNNVVDAGEAITLNQEIAKADLDSGLFKFNPVANDYGTPYASFNFKWYNGISYSALEFTQSIYVIKYIAGDVSRNGVIDGSEIAGDINKNGVIDSPSEVAGDVDGDGKIDNGEIAGDLNGNGVIDRPTEVTGDINGNGTIDRPAEIAGDGDGDGVITAPELAGDVNGDLAIVSPELLGDLNGNGILDDGASGINVLDANALVVYPTVTSDYINIQGNNNSEVVIYNAGGNVVLKTKANRINVGAFGKGAYVVKIAGNTTKVIVK